jgi:hypothetical protein
MKIPVSASIIPEMRMLLVELDHHLSYDFVAVLGGHFDVLASARHNK